MRAHSGPRTVPATYMRGGTSKGVFLRGRDLPPPGPERDRIILDIMGSPDPLQIDGLGGTYSSTSKVVLVDPGDGDDDIRYEFAQVGVDTVEVDWAGNCGNLTTAVGVYAIEEGLVAAVEPVTSLLLRNVNTGVAIRAEVPVRNGHPLVQGDHAVAGVPGTGAPIATHYLDPGGGVCGRELPTGRAHDTVETADGAFPVSIVDVTHPYAFVAAKDIGLALFEHSVAELNADQALVGRLNLLRDGCAGLIARSGWAGEPSPTVPRLVLVGPAQAPPPGLPEGEADFAALALSMGAIHRALPMTGALCAAAAARIPGTIPSAVARSGSGGAVRILHPRGVVSVLVDLYEPPGPRLVRSVGVVRTARVLMSGLVHLHPESP
ncbi:MAG: PrpF domain-containing protein [Dehalococcoidia bacterium]